MGPSAECSPNDMVPERMEMGRVLESFVNHGGQRHFAGHPWANALHCLVHTGTGGLHPLGCGEDM